MTGLRSGTGAPPARRPAHDELTAAWASAPGWPGFLSAVNHKQIGLRFIWTAGIFLIVGGVEALLVRVQLARPENQFLSPETYNQIFTMHGTTMMFLFAVPILEGLAMYLTPLQVGTRDMPFPRLNAFGYWCYLFGGLLLNWSLVSGSVPDGGWFSYTPLSGPEFSPTRALDFWLIGVTLVEIAGIVGAVELVVLLLKQRAPGMTLARLPLFGWGALAMAAMMLFAFPVVLTASLLLELERKLGAPFYDAAGGGNPLLWQHLFWIFGHPEVYIIFIPATGIVSAVIAAHVGRKVVAYPLVVASIVATTILSFGLWVHHMFAVGLPALVLALFAVSSYFIAVPTGVQFFAWIATIWGARPRVTVPLLFVAGFVVIFLLGGVTGVMVATAPFDLQAHDTYFVVAHLHYVLIGGAVFPIFAGLHHWLPKMTGRMACDRPGKAAFWLMFIGFNVTFFPQHWLGLQGMIRRAYTYSDGFGWNEANLASSVGSFVLGIGIAVFIANLLWSATRGRECGPDPWNGDTLEWATASPPAQYNFATFPEVTSVAPGWDRAPKALDPETAQALIALERPYRGRREVLRTSLLDGRPEAVFSLPGPSYWPLIAALAITVGLIGVLVDWWLLAGAGALAFVAAWLMWVWSNAAAARTGDDEIDDGDQRVLAEARALAARRFALEGPPGRSSVFWGVAVGGLAIGTVLGALVYSYGYLSISVDDWPPPGSPSFELALSLAALGGAVLSAIAQRSGAARLAAVGGIGTIALVIASMVRSGLRVDANAYEAIVLTLLAFAIVLLGAATAGSALARSAPVAHRDAIGALWGIALLAYASVFATVHLGPPLW